MQMLATAKKIKHYFYIYMLVCVCVFINDHHTLRSLMWIDENTHRSAVYFPRR
jgi:hypothetical protein